MRNEDLDDTFRTSNCRAEGLCTLISLLLQLWPSMHHGWAEITENADEGERTWRIRGPDLAPKCAASNCFASTFDDCHILCKLPSRSWTLVQLTSSIFSHDDEEKTGRETSAPYIESHDTELQCLVVLPHVLQELWSEAFNAQRRVARPQRRGSPILAFVARLQVEAGGFAMSPQKEPRTISSNRDEKSLKERQPE